jgi:hypothetical protein
MNTNATATRTTHEIRIVILKFHEVSFNIITDMIDALLGNSSVNMVQHATIEEAVFSVDPTDTPIDWLDSDHMMCLL